MKKHHIPLNQYASETKNYFGGNEDFLEKTAPLIGYIVHGFNFLEEMLNSAICKLFWEDCDRLGLIVICNMNYSAKADLFKRLVQDQEKIFENEIPCFNNLRERIQKAGEYRNSVIHADWETAHPDGFTFCKLKFKNQALLQEYVQFSPESLQGIIDYIDETIEMFEKYEDEREELINKL